MVFRVRPGLENAGGQMRILVGAWGAILLLCSAVSANAQGGRPVVAIYQIDDIARSGQAAALTTMIETAIASTNKFRVIEREQMNKLLGEQARAKSGLVTTNQPGRIGGFEGADFLIYGSITTISVDSRADIGTNLVMGFLGSSGSPAANCNNAYATLGLDIKITDASTGEVRYVKRIDQTQKSATACGNSRASIDTTTLLRGAAEEVAAGLVTAIYPIQVAAVQPDGMVVLNYGEGTVTPGDVLGVFSKGMEIRDPATGEILAYDEVQLGLLRVESVTGRVSRAVALTELTQPLPIGSIVRPASPAAIEALNQSRRRR